MLKRKRKLSQKELRELKQNQGVILNDIDSFNTKDSLDFEDLLEFEYPELKSSNNDFDINEGTQIIY